MKNSSLNSSTGMRSNIQFYEWNIRKTSYLNKSQTSMFKSICLDIKCMISNVGMFKPMCLDIKLDIMCMISTVSKIKFML